MSFPLAAMLIVLIATTLMGFPVGLALFGSGILYFIVAGQDPSYAGELILHGLFSAFVLLAVPLFIFAARVMNDGGITDRLLNLCLAMVGRFRGGLAQVNLLTCLVFSSMSGSATADAAGIGRVLIKMMTEKNRYPPGFAAAVTAAGATVGPIFPPSIIMVFYAVVSSTSIGALFLAGVIPGILMTIVMMIAVSIMARRRNFPIDDSIPRSAYARVIVDSIIPLSLPSILLGGIYTGAFTPTEAAGVAGFLTLIICATYYRSLGIAGLFDALVDTVKTTGQVASIVFGAFVFSYILTVERIPQAIAQFLQSMEMGQVEFFLIVNVILLILGCLMDTVAIIMVVVPLLLPSLAALGIDPVHFGLVVTLNVTIGLVTPPYGVLLFVVSSINNIPVMDIIREIWIFIVMLIALLLVVTYVPALSLFLPQLFGFAR